jgi:carotenoid cleavage dioxygenase-like enzyme
VLHLESVPTRSSVRSGAEVAPGSSGVVAVDLEQGEVRRHRRDGLVFGEPVFVGRPGAAVEGDGVLLTVGTSAVEARTELHVLDARTLELVAEAAIPAATPLGFHGAFQRARA